MSKAQDVLNLLEEEKKKGKTLFIRTQNGNDYDVSLEPETLGHVVTYNQHTFKLPHPSWKVIGFSHHHMTNHPDMRISVDTKSEDIRNTYVWDVDHGTTRRWGDKVRK